jgi:hypothetical protein
VTLPASDPRPAFAHASEAELARILDFYEVRWSYEPETFPIGWNLDGDVVESFSPDFYLPDLDLYVETDPQAELVRKKNRRAPPPASTRTSGSAFYARDFRALLLKFRRMALWTSSGTSGRKATPPKPARWPPMRSGRRLPAPAGLVGAAGRRPAPDPGRRRAGLPGRTEPGPDGCRAAPGGATPPAGQTPP